MDLGKVLTVSFDYELVSGTLNFSGTLGSQTLMVYIYDATAGAANWIQPAGYLGMNQSSGPGRVTATFQSSVVAGQKYRVAVIASQAVGSACSLEFDNFTCSRMTAPIGPVVTDWVSYTPTGTWVSGATYSGRWRRVGDSLQASIKIGITGAVTATDLQVNIPAGLSIDTTKMASSDFLQSTFGSAHGFKGAAHYNFQIAYSSATSLFFTYQSQLTGQVVSVTNTAPVTWANGDQIHATFMVPIQGWSSSVQMSSDTDTRVVSLSAGRAQAAVTGGANITGFTTLQDTHGAFNASTGIYTIPVTGDYVVAVSGTLPLSASCSISTIYDGSGVVFTNTATAGSTRGGSSVLLTGLTAGKTISFRSDASVTLTAELRISIHRLSGPSVIAASETVAARYRTGAGQTIPNNIATLVDYSQIKEIDTHNAYRAGVGYNSATGTYTTSPGFVCPVSGVYEVSVSAMSASVAWVAINHTFISLVTKNGTSVAGSSIIRVPTTGTYQLAVSTSSTLVQCNAGDVLNGSVFNVRGASTNLDPDALYTYINIQRVG
jgi:hypothetical protein